MTREELARGAAPIFLLLWPLIIVIGLLLEEDTES